MTPTPEIIALARRFHELGGTKGIELSIFRWVVHPVIDFATLIVHKQDIQLFKTVECIPILTADELWEWLDSHCIWRMDGTLFLATIHQPQAHAEEWFDPKELGLLLALYKAAVWVAERMK